MSSAAHRLGHVKFGIWNVEYLLWFSTGRRSGKFLNRYIKFEIHHVQINGLQRS